MGEQDGGGCISCCCRCVVTLCGSLIFFGLVVLIYWASFQPHHIRATVDSASLSNLTVSNSTTASSVAEVSYKLAVNLNLYNPSVRVNIYYDTIDAKLCFRDAVVGPAANGTSPSEFYQRRKTSDGLKLEFDYGRPGVGVAADVAGELQKEMSRVAPVLRLELDLDVRVRYVFRIFKLRQKPRIWCPLSIPVMKAEGPVPAAVGGAVASGERCTVKY